MKKTWIAAGILLLYALLTVSLTLCTVHLYNLLGETDSVFRVAEPWIKLFVSGFPIMQGFAVISVLAFFGIRGVFLTELNTRQTKGASV